MVNQVLEKEPMVNEKIQVEEGDVFAHPFVLLGRDGIEEVTGEKLAYSSSLQYGFGLFETIKIFSGNLFFWHDHYWRMYNSVKSINIPFYWSSYDLWRNIKKSLLGKYSEGMLRLYLFLSPLYGYKNLNSVESKMLCSLLTDKIVFPSLARLYISDVVRYSKDYLVKHKMTQRAHLILVSKMYQKAGAYEGLLLNENGHITEGTRSNIFFYKNGRFFTPSLETGILPGVTRKKIIEIIQKNGYEIEEGFYTPSELLSAEEIFMTFTTCGVVPINEVVGYDKKYKIDKSLQLFNELEKEVNKNNEYFRVLFICRENSIRSIMAENIMNKISNGKIKVMSAGLKSSHINPLTKKILQQENMFNPLSYSKELSNEMLTDVDFVISICDVNSCPTLKNLDSMTIFIKWDVEEPENNENSFSNTYKKIRSLCEEFLLGLGI